MRQLTLADAGRAELDRCEAVVELVQRKILAGLPQEDQAQFLRLLEKLVGASNQDSRAPLM